MLSAPYNGDACIMNAEIDKRELSLPYVKMN